MKNCHQVALESKNLGKHSKNGNISTTFKRGQGSYYERLKYAFTMIGLDRPALVTLDWSDMKPTSEEIQNAKSTTVHKELAKRTDTQTQNYLVAIEALRKCNRHQHQPLQ